VRRFAPLIFAAATACNTPATKSGITNDVPEADASAGRGTSGTSTSASADASATRRSDARLKIVEATADSDAVSLIRTKRLEAKAESRVLVVYIGATWCEPCKKFKAEMAAGRLDDRLGKTTLLAFDADRDMDRLGSAGYTFRFVPFVALPGADGHPADSQQATGKGGEAWRELLGKLDAWQRGT
jgi:thiol-disulfide isomerase/thioredoxin